MNLKQHYQEKVIPTLMQEFNISNRMAVPRIQKISLNIGLKEAVGDKGVLNKTSAWLGVITGQKPKVTQAKQSIAGFKIRAGDPVGMAVTLRGQRMYDFLAKLFSIVLLRVRDFQGVSTAAFDHNGNYTLGLAEQIVFPEVEYSQIDKVRGLEITMVTNSGSGKISQRLLELMGLPFRKEGRG